MRGLCFLAAGAVGIGLAVGSVRVGAKRQRPACRGALTRPTAGRDRHHYLALKAALLPGRDQFNYLVEGLEKQWATCRPMFGTRGGSY